MNNLDDISEALRLCREHRDHLLGQKAALDVKVRVMQIDLDEERAMRRDLQDKLHTLTLKYSALADEVASVYPSECVVDTAKLSSPGPAVSSSIPPLTAADVPHDYPQGPGDLK